MNLDLQTQSKRLLLMTIVDSEDDGFMIKTGHSLKIYVPLQELLVQIDFVFSGVGRPVCLIVSSVVQKVLDL